MYSTQLTIGGSENSVFSLSTNSLLAKLYGSFARPIEILKDNLYSI
jgi:hypothetical protein